MDKFFFNKIDEVRTGSKNHIIKFKNGFLFPIPIGNELEFLKKLNITLFSKSDNNYKYNFDYLQFYFTD